jgi:hypothetical protein
MSEAQLDSKISVLLELLSDLETRISKLELEVKHGELSRFRPTQPASSVSLADIGRVPVESELSEDTRDKLKKTADLILQYCRKSVPYLGT